MGSLEKVDAVGQGGYPRPQLRRAEWTSLDGSWAFAIDARAELGEPEQVTWDKTIAVPFSPETPLSGVGDTGFYSAVWYKREFARPVMKPGERLMLHFGAVDYETSVWVNGMRVGRHHGGYTPFSLEITFAVRGDGPQEVVVRAVDDPADLEKPRGKQDWKLEPHSIWYPRTTGIWQTVWLEVVPSLYVAAVKWTSSLKKWEIGLDVYVEGGVHDGVQLAVRIWSGQQTLAMDGYTFVTDPLSAGSKAAAEIHRKIALSDPGIDDFRNDLLWSPGKPTILDVELTLVEADGTVIDKVLSYTALRSIAIQGDRFILNGRPFPLRLVLDQGYWPESGLTAPSGGCVRYGHFAGQVDGVQWGAEAPKGGGSSVSLLGGSPGADGLGGDAVCLPVYAAVGGAADAGVAGGDETG